MRANVTMTALTLCLLTFGSAYADDYHDTRDVQSVSYVNKGIQITDGAHTSTLSTVNGSISVGDHATVASAKTVNGSVHIGEESHSETLGTVNGDVSVGKNSVVAGDITSVNGELTLSDDAVVQGAAKNVNSNIIIGQRAHVGGRIVTTNGDITLQDNARVDGGIRVRDYSRGWFDYFFDISHRTPVISIGPGARVGGELVFEHAVELRVHSTAKIGPVIGAKVQRY
jgi:hypothetical protein